MVKVSSSLLSVQTNIQQLTLNSIQLQRFKATDQQAVEGLDSDVVERHCQVFHRQVADHQHPRRADQVLHPSHADRVLHPSHADHVQHHLKYNIRHVLCIAHSNHLTQVAHQTHRSGHTGMLLSLGSHYCQLYSCTPALTIVRHKPSSTCLHNECTRN